MPIRFEHLKTQQPAVVAMHPIGPCGWMVNPIQHAIFRLAMDIWRLMPMGEYDYGLHS
jgi:hypothetical protein